MSSAKCLSIAIAVLITGSGAIAETPGNSLWNKFEHTRQSAPSLHQEFDVELRAKSSRMDRYSHYRLTIDFFGEKWREQVVGGKGELVRVFDGQDLLVFENEGPEYTRTRKSDDKDRPWPGPYEPRLDWDKSKVIQSLPCGLPGKDHTCVVMDVPIRPRFRLDAPGHQSKMAGGTTRLVIDTETGVWLRCQTSQLVEESHGDYQWDLTYTLKQMGPRATSEEALYKVPDGLREVRRLTPWNESRIKKQLAGKPAPDLQVTDIGGTQLTLAKLKGRTVLLDFWTTWCPPCQADASSLEKLNQKYGGKNLTIVGISVDESRATVEKYLKRHPHSFPVVLSSENLLPKPYEIGIFPTYLIISPDGTLTTAEEGDQGLVRLRKELEKAGLETE